MKPLPEGKSLGWMQAPASWISSHTVRFVGLVRVVIQDGEGFILVKKGTPLFHYFRQGTIELKGNSARDYFNSYPIIEFNLCKYSADEFAWALKTCNIEDAGTVVPKERAVAGPELREQPATLRPADPPVATPAGDKRVPDQAIVTPQVQTVENRTAVSGPVIREQSPPPSLTEPLVTTPAGDKRVPDQAIVTPQVQTAEEKPAEPQPGAGDDPDLTRISQIKDLDGIVAISVFNEEKNLIMIGDADSEVLKKISQKMLETAQKITSRLTWGHFVHMTLQIPEGNMIIAPYQDNYLCLLTTRSINIGHIRRILRDLPQKEAPRQES